MSKQSKCIDGSSCSEHSTDHMLYGSQSDIEREVALEMYHVPAPMSAILQSSFGRLILGCNK